jgi:signal transduction histidine kinase
MAAKPRNGASAMTSRLVLIAGFGGLLAMMAFAEFDGVHALREIQKANDDIREDFLLRTRLLERIRGDVYVSGTYVRDYLLEPESGKAEGHRYSLLETRTDMDEALSSYRTLLKPTEAAPFQVLTQALETYWKVLEPVFDWPPERRKRSGYFFLRDEVSPGRMAMLGIADQIRALNEAQVNQGRLRVEQTFAEFERRSAITIGVTVGLGLLLAAFSIRKILNLEGRTAVHMREISSARTQLQELSARLLEAQEEERRSISRELHDEVGQSLTGVLVEMANLSTLIRSQDSDALSVKAAEIKKLLESSISVVRNMALLLRPSMLDDLGLAPALQWQAREVSKRSGVWVTVSADGIPEDLPEEYKTCIYRVTQEALHNCVQHSGARNIKVVVKQEEQRLRLSVEDDGKGFDPAREKGMGLLGIQERVSRLRGTFTVDTLPGAGATLHVTLPLAAPAPQPDPQPTQEVA